MGSTDEKVRIRQREEAEAAVKSREEALAEKGVTGKDLEKDPALRAAKAALKKARNRVTAISARDAEVAAAKEKREKAKAKKEQAKAKAAKKKGGGKGGDGKKAKKAKKKQ